MAKLKLRGKDLRKIGYPENKVIGIAMEVMHRHYKRNAKHYALGILKAVLENPEAYKEDAVLSRIAAALTEEPKPKREEVALREEQLPFKTYGASQIDDAAKQQLEVAMRLPITVAGALMPDAHVGYGLPIGGVLATENAVIPYGVGVDIGCRMALSVYPLKPKFLEKRRSTLKQYLEENTRFGQGAFSAPMDDEVLDREEFRTIPTIKALKDKAYRQIGSSGGGNHFVEFGVVELTEDSNDLGLSAGYYMGLLSHSGSRGLGANIANHYTRVAMEQCRLPKAARHLAWLSLDSAEGIEYWLAMNLAGDYASACHRHIHQRMAKALGESPIATVENHHNFAWKEQLANGQEVIVHRKGATPATKGVLGIIPGSMTDVGFIVKGKGDPISINSAAHGAGRVMSRSKAKNSITPAKLQKHVKQHGVELIGGGVDEAPMVYKDIHQVMAYQQDLVEIVGTFLPRIVRMC